MKGILLDTESPKVKDIICLQRACDIIEEADAICCVNINDGKKDT